MTGIVRQCHEGGEPRASWDGEPARVLHGAEAAAERACRSIGSDELPGHVHLKIARHAPQRVE